MTQPESTTMKTNQPQLNRPEIHPAPIPDPEPASPSLDEPDPAVFHHTPSRPDDDSR